MILFRQLAAISASSVKSTPILEKSVVPPTAVKLIGSIAGPLFYQFFVLQQSDS
jgi:hypothetical protein